MHNDFWSTARAVVIFIFGTLPPLQDLPFHEEELVTPATPTRSPIKDDADENDIGSGGMSWILVFCCVIVWRGFAGHRVMKWRGLPE